MIDGTISRRDKSLGSTLEKHEKSANDLSSNSTQMKARKAVQFPEHVYTFSTQEAKPGVTTSTPLQVPEESFMKGFRLLFPGSSRPAHISRNRNSHNLMRIATSKVCRSLMDVLRMK
jgi:hypothetical protein